MFVSVRVGFLYLWVGWNIDKERPAEFDKTQLLKNMIRPGFGN